MPVSLTVMTTSAAPPVSRDLTDVVTFPRAGVNLTLSPPGSSSQVQQALGR